MTELLDMDASTLAEKIRAGEITSAEAVEGYIRHIERVNPHIRAVVETRFDEARREAEERDRLLQEGKARGRLWGVPISMKEAFFVKGMHTTGGLPHRRGAVDAADAEIVRRLKEEGAIILGKTNTPALCYCQETENTLFGRTNNPWDLSRTAGGSSGGEGALIAVGGAAVGIGSDIGGSIRFPAHFNGVIGFKSGNRQVSLAGAFPDVKEPHQVSMFGIGALAKSVKDAEKIHAILAFQKPPSVDIDAYRLVVPPPHPDAPVGEETAELLEAIRSEFASGSLTVMPPFFEQAALMWQWIMSVDGGEELVRLCGEKGFSGILRQYLKGRFKMRVQLHPYLTWALLGTRLFRPSKKEWIQLRDQLRKGEEEVKKFLQNRVLVFPVYHCAAPEHGKVYGEIFSIRKTFLRYLPYVAYANTFGLPSLTIPVGTVRSGLPIGLQLITAVGQEDALFQWGRRVESAFRGYVRCKKYDAEVRDERGRNVS